MHETDIWYWYENAALRASFVRRECFGNVPLVVLKSIWVSVCFMEACVVVKMHLRVDLSGHDGGGLGKRILSGIWEIVMGSMKLGRDVLRETFIFLETGIAERYT